MIKSIVKVLAKHNGKILLLRRSKTAPRRPLQWDFPGGIADNNDFLNEVLRELEEEAGLKGENCILAYKCNEDFHGDKVDFRYYYCKTNSNDVKLSYEHDKFIWVDFDKINDYIEYEKQQRAVKEIAKVILP